jgi:hypothetical protein
MSDAVMLAGKGGLLAVVVTLLITAPAAAMPGVPAVKAGKVYLLNGGELAVPGPRVVLTAQTFGRALDPDLMPGECSRTRKGQIQQLGSTLTP